MPNLTEQHRLFSRLNRRDGAAIVELIDMKTEADMEKVLNKLDVLTSRIDSLEKSVDARLTSFEKSVDARFHAMYWLIGVAVTIAVAAAKFL